MKRIIAFAFFVILLSCNKKDRHEDTKTPTLVLNLLSSALTVQQIDSADVVFRKVGTAQTVSEKFLKQTSTLTASLKSLAAGTWNADVEVYTKAVNGQSHQYKIIKPISITGEIIEVELRGPEAVPGNGWLKRNVKASSGNEVVLIVPDDVYDAYFEFRVKTANRYVFGVQREAINTNYVVGQKTWACTETCLDAQKRIINTDHFLPFTQTVFSSPWTRNVISIAVLNAQQEEILDYHRTWVP